MGYRKPTLVETYAELHLVPDALTEAHFFDVVPELKKAGFTDIEFTTVGLDIKGGLPRQRQRVRCWREGRTELAQVGEDLLVVNLTGTYPGWDAFTELFDVGQQALEAGLGHVEVHSLNLLTTDIFEAAKEGFSISRYLDVGGRVIPNWYEDCSESLDLTLGRGLLPIDGRNRQVRVKVDAGTDPVKVQVHAQFHDVVEGGVSLRDVLERLHAESNRTFESVITDHLRDEVMGGVA